jgi:predicted deacetylase
VQKRLFVSVHDVGPRFAPELEKLADRLTSLLGGFRFAMLVVPNHWGEGPLTANGDFARTLRRWAAEGVEMFVHGWFHRDDAAHNGLARLKARHLTAGEGEFLGLSATEAARRMADGKALLEDIIGRPASGFVAPAWLYGAGALEALAASGFPLAEDHMRVWSPQSDATLARGPVITWATRTPARTVSSLAFAALARTALKPLKDVRIAVHPGDVTKESTLASIDRTVQSFASTRPASRYSELLV